MMNNRSIAVDASGNDLQAPRRVETARQLDLAVLESVVGGDGFSVSASGSGGSSSGLGGVTVSAGYSSGSSSFSVAYGGGTTTVSFAYKFR